ncbi:hypothetical protein [Streptomyces virginiae]|uniref:hypothetical protein n=1 Tax=Streptomyces virginiae TaxID=1961 RepID=UPI00365B3607
MNFTDPAIVSLAPLGASAKDDETWTTIGYLTGFQLGTDRATDPLDLVKPMPTSMSKAVKALIQWMPAENHVPSQCLQTRRAIEDHAQLIRILRQLVQARRTPVVHPCPLPFTARDAT